MSRTCKEGKIKNICISDPVGSGASASAKGLSLVNDSAARRVSALINIRCVRSVEALSLSAVVALSAVILSA